MMHRLLTIVLAQYRQKNAVVMGISVDSTNCQKQFCTKEGLNFKLLADPYSNRFCLAG